MFTLADLNPLIEKRSLLQHPFYLKWSKGELTKKDLQIYAKEYYHLVKGVPAVVGKVLEKSTVPSMNAFIEENMQEEQEHVELWERFAKSLGVDKAELEQYMPSQKTRDAVEALKNAAQESMEAGVCVMYALEAELPKIAATKKEGLSAWYDLKSEDAHIYFDEHLKEEKHLEVWRKMKVSAGIATPSANVSLDAQHKVLDAVCDIAGIACAM